MLLAGLGDVVAPPRRHQAVVRDAPSRSYTAHVPRLPPLSGAATASPKALNYSASSSAFHPSPPRPSLPHGRPGHSPAPNPPSPAPHPPDALRGSGRCILTPAKRHGMCGCAACTSRGRMTATRGRTTSGGEDGASTRCARSSPTPPFFGPSPVCAVCASPGAVRAGAASSGGGRFYLMLPRHGRTARRSVGTVHANE